MYSYLSQLHNYMSARRPTITNLAGFMKSIMKMETPRKNWPNIARLPGDYKPPEETNFKPNLVAYQVDRVGNYPQTHSQLLVSFSAYSILFEEENF